MVRFLLRALLAPFRSRLALQAENLALRHQLAVYQRTCTRPRLNPADRVLWSWLSRLWAGWRDALVIVQPTTVIAWRRRKFREHWAKLIRSGKQGRPAMTKEVRDLIDRKLEGQADPALPMNEMWSIFSAGAWEAGDPELGR